VCVCAIGATTVVNTHLANFDEDYPRGAQLGQPNKPEQMNFDEEKNLEGKPSRIDCQADLKKAVAALADLHSKAEGVLHEMHYSVLPKRLQPGHEHDLVGCEKVCEGHGYDKDTCDSMKGCHFDEHDQQCFSFGVLRRLPPRKALYNKREAQLRKSSGQITLTLSHRQMASVPHTTPTSLNSKIK
jgi:hypothetical protein